MADDSLASGWLGGFSTSTLQSRLNLTIMIFTLSVSKMRVVAFISQCDRTVGDFSPPEGQREFTLF